MMGLLLINNSGKLFIAEAGWKINTKQYFETKQNVSSYKNHPDIIKLMFLIVKDFPSSERFSSKTVNESEIKDLSKI